MAELFDLAAHELHDLLIRKETSSAEITDAVLNRLKATEDKIGAYITVLEKSAKAEAAAADKKISEKLAQGENVPFLMGIPGAIKDNICTKGIKTTCASKMLENFVAPYDAAVSAKLKGESAVIVGKTNLDEFAMGGSTENSAMQTTHNPHDLTCVPGGSSGGSAAAVAAGSAIWALGSDTGGSIRQPASFCGIVGLKPTYGRVSRYGLVAYASSLDQIGPLTRDVTDAAHILAAIAGNDAMDSTSSPEAVPDFAKALTGDIKGLKIGLPKEYFVEGIAPEVKDAVKKAVEKMASLGAEVVEISLPHTEYAVSTYYLIAPAEAATNLARYDGVGFGARVDGADVVEMMTRTRTEKFGAEVKRRIMIGNYALSAGYYDAYYLKALKVRTLIAQDFQKAFETVDLVACPTAPTVAYGIGALIDNPLEMYLMDISTVPLNLAGLPGISLPCGVEGKMPIGLQIIGKPLDEMTVLKAAYAYEQSQDFTKTLRPATLLKGGEA